MSHKAPAKRLPIPCLSYLPGELAQYLDEEIDSFGTLDSEIKYLHELREYVTSGYYRAAAHRSWYEHLEYVGGSSAGLIADIYCMLHPFNLRLAYDIAYSLKLDDPSFRNRIMRACVFRFNVTAFRFFSPPFSRDFDKILAEEFHREAEFFPGYLELLAVGTIIIPSNGLIGYVLPRTYELLLRIGILSWVPEGYACHAIDAGNYRLAKYLKTKHPERDFQDFVFEEYKQRSSCPCNETLTWLLENNWVTPEQVEELKANEL